MQARPQPAACIKAGMVAQYGAKHGKRYDQDQRRNAAAVECGGHQQQKGTGYQQADADTGLEKGKQGNQQQGKLLIALQPVKE